MCTIPRDESFRNREAALISSDRGTVPIPGGRLGQANDMVEFAKCQQPDVVLLDIDMPGRDSFRALDPLRQVLPAVRVLTLSGLVRSDPYGGVKAGQAGGEVLPAADYGWVG